MFDKIIPEAASAAFVNDEFKMLQAKMFEKLPEYLTDLVFNKRVNFEESYIRSSTAGNMRRLRDKSVCVIGAGGIGTWIVRALAGMGVSRITVYDFDNVEIQNIGPQNYSICDIGMPKIEALKQEILYRNGISIEVVNEKICGADVVFQLMYNRAQPFNYIISAVDNMEFRNSLGYQLCDSIEGITSDSVFSFFPEMFIDLRMGLGYWNSYCLPVKLMAGIMASDNTDNEHEVRKVFDFYRVNALFPEEQGDVEPCTERAIVYCGMNLASYVSALIHWANDNLTSQNVFNFLAMYDTATPFKWMHSFNSREWINVIEPAKIAFARKKSILLIDQLNKDLEMAHNKIREIENLIPEPALKETALPKVLEALEANSPLTRMEIASDMAFTAPVIQNVESEEDIPFDTAEVVNIADDPFDNDRNSVSHPSLGMIYLRDKVKSINLPGQWIVRAITRNGRIYACNEADGYTMRFINLPDIRLVRGRIVGESLNSHEAETVLVTSENVIDDSHMIIRDFTQGSERVRDFIRRREVKV